MATGKLSRKSVATSDDPSFLVIHPNGKTLYAANEIGNYRGEKAGAISAFAIDPKSGSLTLLNQQSSRGTGPCHLVVDKPGGSS